MTHVTNIVKEPSTEGRDGTGKKATSWWTNATPAANPLMGGRDNKGNPLTGLQVGQNTRAVQTDIEGVEPGDTVRLYLQISTGKLHAGLYRNRLATPSKGDPAEETERTDTEYRAE